MHAASALPPAHALPPPGPHLAPHRTPPFDSRQNARKFNQPLSFDTSSVTDMGDMFRVRSSPFPACNLQSSPPLHAACAAVARGPLVCRPAPRPASYALLSTLGRTRGSSTGR